MSGLPSSDLVLRKAEQYWSEPRGLFWAELFLLLGLLSGSQLLELQKVSLVEWLLVFAASLLLGGIWWRTNRLPRTKTGRVGFFLALAYEDSDHAARLGSDFVRRLRQLIERTKATHRFEFHNLNPSQAKKVRTFDDARQLLAETRGHFMIFGQARERDVDGDQAHVLDIDGLVRHSEVEDHVREQLSTEFSKVLPDQLIVARERDVFTLRFTARYIEIVCKYIVGIASAISGDLDYSYDLFRQVERLLENTGQLPATLAHIRTRIGQRIAQVLKAKAHIHYQRYRLDRNIDRLRQIRPLLEEIDQYDSAWYSGDILAAILAFTLDRDLETAERHIRRCRNRNIEDPTWLYSEAFLKAYQSDLRGAYRSYREAFEGEVVDTSIPIQTEEFINEVLDEEPEQGQLYYCLGLVNYYAKEDLAAARRDFQQFLDATEADGGYNPQRAHAEELIGKIDQKLRT